MGTFHAFGAAVAILAIWTGTAAVASSETAAQRCARNADNGDVATCILAVRENPNDLQSRRNLARSYSTTANYRAAIRVYREIAAERPSDPQSHFDLAGLFGAIRRYQDAVEPIETVLRLQPENILAHQAAAVIYAQLGRMKDSVAVTHKAAEREDSTSMYEMSLYFQDGIGVKANQEKAFYWAEKAASMNHVAAIQLMTETYLEGLFGQEPDNDRAIEWARRVRELIGAKPVK